MNTPHYTSIPKVFGCLLKLRVGLPLLDGSSGVNTSSIRVYPASSLSRQSAWTPSPKYESSLTEPARRLMRCIHQVFGCGFLTVLNVNSEMKCRASIHYYLEQIPLISSYHVDFISAIASARKLLVIYLAGYFKSTPGHP